MTLFETVKITLDELYKETQEEHGDECDTEIKAQSGILTKSYGKLTEEGRKKINYSDPATRFAYVHKYTAAHGDYVYQTLRNARIIAGSALFQQKELRISCVGGGPGSDVIGILKYLAENKDEAVEKITCYLLDGEQAWADTWTEVGSSLAVDISLSVHFQKLDVTDSASWAAQKKFLKSDIFTLSYFVSEVYAFDCEAVIDFWDTLFDKAKTGAMFLYIDNGHASFNDYFDKQWNERDDFQQLINTDNRRMLPGFDEQSSELSVYKEKFGNNPKIQSYLSTRVLRKVES